MTIDDKDIKIPSKDELLDVIDTSRTDIQQSIETEYSDIELEAMEHGWNPEGAEGKRNLSAEEFMDRQPLFDEIKSLKKRQKKLESELTAFAEFSKTVRQSEREKVLKELKEAKKLAMDVGDHGQVIELDEKIAEVNADKKADNKPVQSYHVEWVAENSWYNEDPEMRGYADMVGGGYAGIHKDATPEEIYEEVTKRVKAKYPEKFEDAPKRKTNGGQSPVEGASRGRGLRTSKGHSASELPERDYKIMQTLIRGKHITEEEYLKQYFS